jgi:hypothetical protein
MKKMYLALVILCALRPGDVFGAGPSSRIPEHIASRFGATSYPAWLSSTAVIDSKGKLNLEALPLSTKGIVARQIESGDYQKTGCIHFGPVNFDRAGPVKLHSSLSDLAKNSIAILQGTVTDIDHGFTLFGPSLLLEIQVSERVKASGDFVGSEYVYLQYPVAQFEAGGYRFCKADSRWPAEPQIGDRVLVFPYQIAYDVNDLVISPDPDAYEVVLERANAKDKRLTVPRGLQDAADLIGVNDLDTVKRYVTEYLKGMKTSEPSML